MMKKTFLYSSLLIVLLATLGCGQNMLEGVEDKGSGDAKQYAALKSLDSGDFQTVLSACDAGTADPLDCSAAALGAAGLDPLEVARQLNDLIGNTTVGATGDISVIGDLDGLNPSYLDEIHDANVQLAQECENTQDQDVCSQLVVTSIAEVVMAIAQVGEKNGITVSDGIDITGGAGSDANLIADIISNDPTVKVDTDGDGTLDTTLLSVIATDASYIIDHINDSPFAGTGFGDVIEEQVVAIGGTDCGTGSTTCVTATELDIYLGTTYGSSQ